MSTTEQRPGDPLRERAIERLEKRADFVNHLAVYLLVNGLLVAVWFFTSRSFFWPIFPLFGWGIGLFFHALETYRRPFSEQRIRQEMQRLQPSGRDPSGPNAR